MSLHWLTDQKEMGESAFLEFLVDFELVLDDTGIGFGVGNDVHRHLYAHLFGEFAGLMDDFGVVSGLAWTGRSGDEKVGTVLAEGFNQPGVLRMEVSVHFNV